MTVRRKIGKIIFGLAISLPLMFGAPAQALGEARPIPFKLSARERTPSALRTAPASST